MRLPPLFGLALTSLGETFEAFLNLQEDVQLYAGFFSLLESRLDEITRFDGEVTSIDKMPCPPPQSHAATDGAVSYFASRRKSTGYRIREGTP